FDKASTKLSVALHQDGNVNWAPARQAPTMPGIREARFVARPGSHLVTLRIGNGVPYTVASLASPNRAMLITLTLTEESELQVSQYLLPIGHLMRHLPARVQEN